MDLKETVCALDSTTIDLCLTLFPWAPFRSTKAAIKLHTLIDLRGNIPSFIHISDGKLHDVNALDELLPEAGAFYVMDRGYLEFERLHRLHSVGAFFVTRAKSGQCPSGEVVSALSWAGKQVFLQSAGFQGAVFVHLVVCSMPPSAKVVSALS